CNNFTTTTQGATLPTGSCNPTSVTVTSGAVTATQTITTTTSAPVTTAANYTDTVTGTSAVVTSVSRSGSISPLVIQDFSVSLTPPNQPLIVGGTAPFTLTVTPLNGFTGTVSFPTCGISPANVGVNLITGCPLSLTINGGPAGSSPVASATLTAPLQ